MPPYIRFLARFFAFSNTEAVIVAGGGAVGFVGSETGVAALVTTGSARGFGAVAFRSRRVRSLDHKLGAAATAVVVAITGSLAVLR